MESLNELFKLTGAIVLGGGSLSAIIYMAFKYLAAKWLDARFEEKLQALKHQQEKEIEGLRFKISAMLDRAVKLHQREFEVLPEAWSMLNDAFWKSQSLMSVIQSYPDIDKMPHQQQIEFISSCCLQDWQKKELFVANKKNELYQKYIRRYNLNDSVEIIREAYTYLIKNGIFINDQLRKEFGVIHDQIWNALNEHQLNEDHDILPRKREHIDKLLTEGEGLMKKLERNVHERLWPIESEMLNVQLGESPRRSVQKI